MIDRTRRIVGCMSGTSMDAIDAALITARGEGLGLSATIDAFASRPLDDMARRLRIAANARTDGAQLARLALDLGDAHAALMVGLGARAGEVDLVAAHGQTIHHAPPESIQLLNPWPLARALGCPVVHDLRAADLAAGGQGAPITPLADWVLFRCDAEPRAIVNLGGFCNITVLPKGGAPDDVRAADVCACNHVVDGVARRVFGLRFDPDGMFAQRGDPDAAAGRSLREALADQSFGGRSLGTGDEALGWLDAHAEHLASFDAAATAADAVGVTIAGWLRTNAPEATPYLAGGGSRNRALVAAIEGSLGRGVRTTADLGVPIDQREAVCIAVLGALAADGVPITLPKVTGRGDTPAIDGAWVNVRPGG